MKSQIYTNRFLLLFIFAIVVHSYSWSQTCESDCYGLGNTRVGGPATINFNGDHNTYVGYLAGYNIVSGSLNSFFGSSAGESNTTGGGNSFFGYQAGKSMLSGLHNSYFGNMAGTSDSLGSRNCFFGKEAGRYSVATIENCYFGLKAGMNSDGDQNCFYGAQSGMHNVGEYNCFYGSKSGLSNAGNYNSFFGYYAGADCTSDGNWNSFFGNEAGRFNTSGNSNAFFGYFTGRLNTSGAKNTFVGENAGERNTIGNSNTYIGENSGKFDSIGMQNTYVGQNAGVFINDGISNVFIGQEAGRNTINGGYNVFIGTGAGKNLSGIGNVMIGNHCGPGSASIFSNRLYINNGVSVTPLIYGEFDSRQVVINGNFEALGIDNSCSRTLKENFENVSKQSILDKINSLPILSWNYKGQPECSHIGPIAEDFQDLFQLNVDNTKISTIDVGGITLAGIQALTEQNEALRSAIANQNHVIQKLIERIKKLEEQ